MNDNFVCIKLDREERPDLDAIYMEACQAMTGHGGWPLNVFLTPEHVPFYTGTYFPPEERQGMPSWTQVLHAVAEAWRERSEEIRATGDRITRRLQGGAALEPSADPLDPGMLDRAVESLRAMHDPQRGTLGGPPNFPPASSIEFLLRRGETEMSSRTSCTDICSCSDTSLIGSGRPSRPAAMSTEANVTRRAKRSGRMALSPSARADSRGASTGAGGVEDPTPANGSPACNSTIRARRASASAASSGGPPTRACSPNPSAHAISRRGSA